MELGPGFRQASKLTIFYTKQCENKLRVFIGEWSSEQPYTLCKQLKYHYSRSGNSDNAELLTFERKY